MKRQLIFILSLLMIAVFTACGNTNGGETSSTEKITESKTSDEKDDSWTEYDTRSEAETAVGFSFSFSDTIGNGAYHEKAFRVKEGVMEVTFVKDESADPEDQYVIWQAKKTDEDISGDSNSYSHDFTIDDCGIDEIRLRGSKDSLAICSFNYGDYSYVIYPGSMSYDETFLVIGELTGIKSTEYTSDDAENTDGIGRFTGEWYCEETTLEDPNMDTGYYALSVDDNGEFSIYDKEAGNPGISGNMTVESDSEVTVDCEEEDFDPPAGWMNMSEKQTLQYEFEGEEELHLIYTENGKTSTLVFHKENME